MKADKTFIGDSLDKVNWDLMIENPDWPETRAKILDEVEEWYWKHGMLLWNTDESRPALRELRKILFPNGGGDVS